MRITMRFLMILARKRRQDNKLCGTGLDAVDKVSIHLLTVRHLGREFMTPSNLKSIKKLSGNERRAAIVKAVREVFAEKGFDGTTTRELAAAAGVSEALLFKHFPNKEALYSAMQTRLLQRARPRSVRAPGSPGTVGVNARAGGPFLRFPHSLAARN